jgi:preprotein translocase subunit SecF
MENNFEKLLDRLIIVPIILLVISISILSYNYFTKGFFIKKDVELSGGLSISIKIKENINPKEIERIIPGSSVRMSYGYGSNVLIVQTPTKNEKEVIEKLKEKIYFNESDVEIGTIDPVVGEIFWRQAKIALTIAFILIGIVVFLAYRAILPSIAMLLSTISDVIITVAVLSILDVNLSLPIIAGLLMIIGYSVDTDVLLATRMLKRSGELSSRVLSAIKTGMTMTLTTMTALLCMYIFSGGTAIRYISLTLLIGLSADIINTWITNTYLFRSWIKRRGGEQ